MHFTTFEFPKFSLKAKSWLTVDWTRRGNYLQLVAHNAVQFQFSLTKGKRLQLHRSSFRTTYNASKDIDYNSPIHYIFLTNDLYTAYFLESIDSPHTSN